MEKAIDETNKRRAKQVAHNILNGITPKALIKPMVDLIYRSASDQQVKPKERDGTLSVVELIQELESEIQYYANSMKEMSKNLRFEEAAAVRDQISELQKELKELREIAR
jgi:excinuclease ABC subunit B